MTKGTSTPRTKKIPEKIFFCSERQKRDSEERKQTPVKSKQKTRRRTWKKRGKSKARGTLQTLARYSTLEAFIALIKSKDETIEEEEEVEAELPGHRAEQSGRLPHRYDGDGGVHTHVSFFIVCRVFSASLTNSHHAFVAIFSSYNATIAAR